MRLASLNNGYPDGRLLLLPPDAARTAPARAAATLADALDNWDIVAPALREESTALAAGGGDPIEPARLLAAMPRSFQFLDASAFLAHNRILAEAWGYERRAPDDPPLMYQGLSDRFLPPHGEVAFASEDDGIDFEAEFGVITDRVPMGVSATDALGHVRLVVMINDWSLRAFGPAEMKAGFGFIHAKPPSALSPFALTPDELGPAWAQGRGAARLTVRRGDTLFGEPEGSAMSFGFGELIAHAARTRSLCPGTVIGSGTVSNDDADRVGSGCIAERIALDKSAGRPLTPFLRFGERVRLDAVDADGRSLFGTIDQLVVRARRPISPPDPRP